MMEKIIVGVRSWDGAPHIQWYAIPKMDSDTARKIAFRKCRGGSGGSTDYNHLIHQTMVVEPEEIPKEVVDFLMQH